MSNACNYTTLLLSELGWEVPEWPLFLMHAQKKADRQSLTLTIIIIVGAIINQMLSSQFLKFPPTSQNLHRKRSSMLGHYFPASLQHPSFYTISWDFRKQSSWKKSLTTIFLLHIDSTTTQKNHIFLNQYIHSCSVEISRVKKKVK